MLILLSCCLCHQPPLAKQQTPTLAHLRENQSGANENCFAREGCVPSRPQSLPRPGIRAWGGVHPTGWWRDAQQGHPHRPGSSPRPELVFQVRAGPPSAQGPPASGANRNLTVWSWGHEAQRSPRVVTAQPSGLCVGRAECVFIPAPVPHTLPGAGWPWTDTCRASAVVAPACSLARALGQAWSSGETPQRWVSLLSLVSRTGTGRVT